MSVPFEADDCFGMLVRDSMADVTLGWYAKVTNRKTGKVDRTKSVKTFRELVALCRGLFKGFHTEKVGASEREVEERALLQRLLDSGEQLSHAQVTRIHALGLKKTASPVVTATGVPRFTDTDDVVFANWCQREPQKSCFEIFPQPNKQPALGLERLNHNKQAIADYFFARPDAIVTLETLDAAFKILDAMQCIQKVITPHRATGITDPIFGGRAKTYDARNDPSLRKSKTFNDNEIAAANRKLVMAGFPQGSRATREQLLAVLGDEALVEFLLTVKK